MIPKDNLRWPVLLALAVLTIAVRLILLYLVTDQNSWDQLYNQSPDVSNYVQGAHAIAESGDFNTTGVNVFGPGYPTFLAVTMSTFDWKLLPFIVQILLSASTTIFICLLITYLTNRRIGIIAAILHILSITSISQSVFLLSETVFLFLLSMGLLVFLKSLRRPNILLSAASGVVLSAATLTRAVGIYLPLLLVIVTVAHWRWWPHPGKASRRTLTAHLLVACGIMLAATLLWSARTYEKTGVFVVGQSQVIAKARILVWLQTEIDRIPRDTALMTLSTLVSDCMARDSAAYYVAYRSVVDSSLKEIMSRRPGEVAGALWKNMKINMRTERGLLSVQLPRWEQAIKRFCVWLDARGLGWRTPIFSLLGLIVLYVSGYRIAAIFFGSLSAYFWLLGTFTLWQGPRIAFPAIVGWSGLVAAALMYVWNWMARGFLSIRKSQRMR